LPTKPTHMMLYSNSRRQKLINARDIASVLFEVLKTVTDPAASQVNLPFPSNFMICLVRNKNNMNLPCISLP